MSVQVYGIPNCGTCKKAFQWLKDNAVTYEFINTKEQPPTRETIHKWVALGDERQDWTNAEWVEAFAKDAMLLKRPLFVKDGTAVLVGFKAEVIREKLGI
ncbi:MAG: arsenate reductase [Oscillatoriales cyanobacterium]|nr:MAG: arsenate reductase [Oscillatoriales cyanobacterium]